jgi:trans-aconitate methyltransferase
MNPDLLKFYTDQLREYGSESPRALAWRNDTSQLSRFQVLSEVGDLAGKSVLDEGCGLGDLYPFLAARFENIFYTGVDINENLINAAKEKYPDLNFQVANFSDYEGGPFDYVLASGSLTFKIPNHKEVYFSHIEKMFALSRIGVAFNMLNHHYFTESDLIATYSPKEVGDFCRTLTENVVLRNDYAAEDFTLYLYH